MLDYLVTSRTRKALLRLLWHDGASGTASELARRAGCAFAGAYGELQAMARAGLALESVNEGRRAYLANRDHPAASALETLLDDPTPADAAPPERSREEVLEKLTSLGLPLSVQPKALAADECPEVLVVAGALETRHDPTAARAFPVLLWRLRDQLDFDRLRTVARRRRAGQTLGFLLAMAAELGDDPRLRREAESLRDRRRRCARCYFDSDSDLARRLADRRTPSLARQWGWTMNVGLDAFEAMFEKFCRDSLPV